MATSSDVRKIALALDGVTEVDHWGRPAFRTKKRIFAVMRPDGLYLDLDDARKDFLFEADPKVFVKYMWGRTANVIVQTGKIGKRELAALIGEAWRRSYVPPKTKMTAAPKRSRS